MIDTRTYERMHSAQFKVPVLLPRCTISDTPEYDPWPLEVFTDKELDDETAMMLPKSIQGFQLEGKKWGKS